MGGNFFPVRVGRFYFQAITPCRQLAECDRRYFISRNEGSCSHLLIDLILVCTEHLFSLLFVRQGINRVTSFRRCFLPVHGISRYHRFGGIALHFLSGHLDIQQDTCVADGESVACFLCLSFAVGQGCRYFVALIDGAQTFRFRSFGYEGDREITFTVNFGRSVGHLLVCKVERVRHIETCPERATGDRPVYFAFL